MAQNKKRTGKGRYTEHARFGSVEARISGKTMFLRNDQTPAEHEQFIARYKQWRAQADDEFRERWNKLLGSIRPYRALSLLGYVYFNETTANLETYREWEHRGQAAKVEHFALLLAATESDGDESLVPVEVSSAVDEYLNFVFANLYPYYNEFGKGGSPTDPDPRFLVLMWELGVRVPLYPWQHRATLQQLFGPTSASMESALGFTVDDALAIELGVERATNAMLAREVPSLPEEMERIRQIIAFEEGTGFVPKPGHEEEALRTRARSEPCLRRGYWQ